MPIYNASVPIMRSQSVSIVLRRMRELGIVPEELVPGLVIQSVEHGVAMELAQLRALCESAAVRIGDASLGLHAARGMAPGAFGLVEFVIRTAPTCGDALDRLVRLVPLLNNLLVFTVERRAGQAIVEARIAGEPLCLGRQANEFVVGVFFKVGSDIAGTTWAPDRVWFPHPAPPDLSPYAPFFGTDRIEFDTGSLGLAFDEKLLELPIPTANVELYTMLDQQARAHVVRLGNDDLEPVREQIRRALHDGRSPELERISAMLGVSPRSLQRRLANATTTFRQLVDDVRHALAKLYLGDHDRPITEVAYLLGFSDLRAFSRAHKRWSGKTPQDVRRGGPR